LWSCCTGHVVVGEPSLLLAAKAVERTFKLSYPEAMFQFLFSCKDISESNGVTFKQMIDIYALPLASAPPVHTLAIESDEADAARYVPVTELQDMYSQKPADCAIMSNPEYPLRLFRALSKLVKHHVDTMVLDDSDDEQLNAKATQLLDTLDDTGQLCEPGKRGDVHRQSVWHRAVHIWLLDTASASVLLLQRSRKKQHFGGQWNCSTDHVKVGDPSEAAAIKSLMGDTGLTRFSPAEFDFMLQARGEYDTGGGCLHKQVIDVYCLVVPSDSYPKAPPVETMELPPGEVDAAQYMPIDELERIWFEGGSKDAQFAIPSSDEYSQRLFYLLRQKVRKSKRAVGGGT